MTALSPYPWSGPVPMTRAAWSALRAEVARPPIGPGDRPDRDLLRRRDVIAGLLPDASIVDESGVAIIGRRVTFRETDGTRMTVALVIPGDGDPHRGWIAIDAPLGAALLGGRRGDTVIVRAPAGEREVRIEAVA